MTLEHDLMSSDLFGLAGTFPRPGWAVLDAARSHGFTGELTFDTIPATKVYLDSGEIYLAERVTDPPLGDRLVDAGALNAAQLEHGQMSIGAVAHLGRLFERVPSVNRDSVLLVTEMMTEECVGWLAGQLVRDAAAAPYHHHPAGIQRWLRPVPAPTPEPGEPLPSPELDEAPLELGSDERSSSPVEPLDDGMIKWDHPAWLDDHLPEPSVPGDEPVPTDTEDAGDADEPDSTTDQPEWSQPAALVAPVEPDTEPFEPFDTEPFEPPVAEPAAPAVEPLEFTQDDSWADPVASTEQPAGDVAWLTSPPSFAEAARPSDQPFAAPTGSASPAIAAPVPHGPNDVPPTRPQPADAPPEPTAPVDDWADLIAAVAEPETGTDQADPLVESDREPAVGDIAATDEVDDADSPSEPGPLTTAPDGSGDEWLLAAPAATDWSGQLDGSAAPETTDQAPVMPESEPLVLPVRPARVAPQPALGFGDEQAESISGFEDWVDRLDADGLPDAGTDLLGTTKRLPPTSAPLDRFEVIWPSGEVDEQFGSLDAAPVVGLDPDLDRVGATAKLKSGLEQPLEGSETGDEVTDEVVLAVRRAVATIETGSLAARRRLVTAPDTDDPSRGVDPNSERVLTPLRHDSTAVENALRPTVSAASHRAPTRSVFDDELPIATPAAEPVPGETVPAAAEDGATRTGALRRLIGSLRRR